MAKPKDLGHLAHIVAYDTENHITVPAGITMHTNQLVASQAWVTTALGSYALSTSLGSYVPTSRTITINGTTYDLSANRSWDITSMIYPSAGIPLSTGSAWGTSITNNSANWNTAYGWGNHASAGYLTSISSLLVISALGYTPYNATNPSGYITGITSTQVTAALGFTPVTNARTITINGTAYDLTANRSWTITATETDTLATVTARGASTNSVVDFGPDSGNNNGIGIRYANDGYGRIRFYNAGTNHSTIHSFGSTWDGGGIAKSQNCINIDGGTGMTVGPWNNPDMYVNKSGTIWAKLNLNTIQVNFRSSTNNAFLTGNGDWGLRLANDHGYIQFGPANGSWTHIYSDKSYYFNQNLYVNGTQVVTNSGTWSINISGSASSASSASYAGYLPTAYAGGVQGNPQVYFNNGIGLKAAMTGSWSTWSDTLWINGYSGGDVPWMCALHFLRNSEPRFAISAQTHTGTGYGGYYEVVTSYNFNKSEPTFSNVYNNGWFRNYGDSGLYQQSYGGHLARNSQSSHGIWTAWGYTKAGYAGLNLQDPQGYNNNVMFENGNGGIYVENGNGWSFYYSRGNNCVGLGGSTTYNWVRTVVNGKLKVESDFISTGWAYFDSNVQFSGGNTQYHQTNEYYNWRDWGGWGGYWINRNGGDMIMNLYALYAVTGGISDIRYKKDVEALPYGLNEIMQLNPIKFHYNLPKESMLANDPDYFLGFSAQEVQGIIPEAVHEKIEEDSCPGMLAITYDELIPVLVNGMKEQKVMIHNQNIKINKLEALVNQLLNN